MVDFLRMHDFEPYSAVTYRTRRFLQREVSPSVCECNKSPGSLVRSELEMRTTSARVKSMSLAEKRDRSG